MLRGDHRIDDELADLGAEFFGAKRRSAVLGGNHNGVDPLGLAVDVFDADLGLAVRAQEIEHARRGGLRSAGG